MMEVATLLQMMSNTRHILSIEAFHSALQVPTGVDSYVHVREFVQYVTQVWPFIFIYVAVMSISLTIHRSRVCY